MNNSISKHELFHFIYLNLNPLISPFVIIRFKKLFRIEKHYLSVTSLSKIFLDLIQPSW